MNDVSVNNCYEPRIIHIADGFVMSWLEDSLQYGRILRSVKVEISEEQFPKVTEINGEKYFPVRNLFRVMKVMQQAMKLFQNLKVVEIKE